MHLNLDTAKKATMVSLCCSLGLSTSSLRAQVEARLHAHRSSLPHANASPLQPDVHVATSASARHATTSTSGNPPPTVLPGATASSSYFHPLTQQPGTMPAEGPSLSAPQAQAGASLWVPGGQLPPTAQVFISLPPGPPAVAFPSPHLSPKVSPSSLCSPSQLWQPLMCSRLLVPTSPSPSPMTTSLP